MPYHDFHVLHYEPHLNHVLIWAIVRQDMIKFSDIYMHYKL